MKFSITDLVTFTEEILYGKLHFLCSDHHFQVTNPTKNFWFCIKVADKFMAVDFVSDSSKLHLLHISSFSLY